MSYILDALRKAEQKRQIAAKVPTLATIHRQPAAVRPPIRLWPWVAGAVIVVNAGVATWLLLPTGTRSPAVLERPGSFSAPGTAAQPAPDGTAPPGPRAAPPAAGGPALPAPAPPPALATPGPPVAAPPATVRGPAPETIRATTKPPETKSEARPAPPQASVRPDQPTSNQKNPSPVVAPGPPASLPAAVKPVPAPRPPATPPAAERAAPGPDRPAVAAIPPANQARPAERAQGSPGTPPQSNLQGVQDMVAKLKLQMVVYSDVPAERLVFINDQKYVEGGTIDGTLRIESITPDGAILSHQGQRFVIRQ